MYMAFQFALFPIRRSCPTDVRWNHRGPFWEKQRETRVSCSGRSGNPWGGCTGNRVLFWNVIDGGGDWKSVIQLGIHLRTISDPKIVYIFLFQVWDREERKHVVLEFVSQLVQQIHARIGFQGLSPQKTMYNVTKWNQIYAQRNVKCGWVVLFYGCFWQATPAAEKPRALQLVQIDLEKNKALVSHVWNPKRFEFGCGF